MNGNNVQNMSEKAVLTDLLSSQKFITSAYNTFCCEAAEPALRSCLLSVLEEEHRTCDELFQTMNQKGYYTVKKAEEKKLSEAKQQFARL